MTAQALVFDENFYLEMYQDVLASGVDPYTHFLEYGAREKRWPNPYFCTPYYLNRYKKELAGVKNWFDYFNQTGLQKGHVPIPNFYPKWYRDHNEDVRISGLSPYLHFVEYGDREFRTPSPSFDPHGYTKSLGSDGEGLKAPFRHWLLTNWDKLSIREEIYRQRVMDLGLLDVPFYLKSNQDVQQDDRSALEHFTRFGASELRRPNSSFNITQLDRLLRPNYKNLIDARYGAVELYLSEFYNEEYDHRSNFYNIWSAHFDPVNTTEIISEAGTGLWAAEAMTSVIYSDADLNAEKVESIKSNLNDLRPRPRSVAFVVSSRERSDALIQSISQIKEIVPTEILTNTEDFRKFLFETPTVLFCLGETVLRPAALGIFEQEQEKNEADIIYCDHDHITVTYRHSPRFKPSFSPIYLNHQNYIGEVLFARAKIFEASDVAMLFDAMAADDSRRLISVCTNKKRDILHLPFVLYHNAQVPLSNSEAAIGAGTLTRDDKTVTLIIPTKDKVDLLRPCIESIFTYTNYDPSLLDVIIVDNNSAEAETHAFFRMIAARPNVSILKYPGSFNFSEINNFAASVATGEVLIFVNNDTLVRDPLWVQKIVAYASLAEVGAVGCKLLYADNTVQHGGCIVGAAGGYIEHLHAGKHVDEISAEDFTREISAVTGACLGVNAKKFWRVGGFKTVLRVAWNDVYLCLSLLNEGYRNVYISDPLLYHYESKSRGLDDTAEKLNQFVWEASYTRSAFPKYFLADPAYNENLSLESATQLAVPPRVFPPSPSTTARKRVLMLSVVFNVGYGVPVVIEKQVAHMVEEGWEVHLGGPSGENEISFPGCKRVILSTSQEAALYAYRNDIGVIVSHTPPFFRVTDFVGKFIPVVCYDYGEPSSSFFDAGTKAYLDDVYRQKLLAFSLAKSTAAISDAVRSEGAYPDTKVIKLGNDHLATWSSAMVPRRNRVRDKNGWQGKTVVLNVCRFPKIERYYKGVDKYASVYNQFNFSNSDASRYVWILAGAAGPDDVFEMERLGLKVFANLSNEALIDLYAAADVYMSFSKWEGYNLGIGQALAMGLPVAASDIEAHREFPIFTSNSAIDVSAWLGRTSSADDEVSSRTATIFGWDSSVTKFERFLADIITTSANQRLAG